MGYVGGKLEPWFSTVPVKKALHGMADRGGDEMVRNVRSFTPVDTRHLRDSISKIPVTLGRRRTFISYESGAETDVEYAEYVERGTGLFGPYHRKYIIRAKNPDGYLKWTDPLTGEPVFRKQVLHPGSEGAHMFARGAAKTEAEFEQFLQPILLRWAREQERVNPWAT